MNIFIYYIPRNNSTTVIAKSRSLFCDIPTYEKIDPHLACTLYFADTIKSITDDSIL